MLRDLPLLALEISSDGRIRGYSDYLLEKTGLTKHALIGAHASIVLAIDSVELILHCFRATDISSVSTFEPISFIAADGTNLPTNAQLVGTMRNGFTVLHLVAIERDATLKLLATLRERSEVIQGFIETSSEPMWCIEFTEPVDLSQNETEIIRQVFANECHWSMCNTAMARFYDIPSEIDMHDTPVAAIFPRSPANEAFVRSLIRNDFNLDRSLSIDIKHDGSTKYVENNVRGHIENNYLHRMWGTVRDITHFKEEQQQLAHSEATVRSILSALPDGVLVATRNRIVKAVNPALEQLFGQPAEELLDRDFSDFLTFPTEDTGRRWSNGANHRWTGEIRHANGIVIPCDIRVAPLDAAQHTQFVLSIRPVAARHGRIALAAE